MILKLMSSENMSDDNTGKGCRIVDDVCEVLYSKREVKEETEVTYETILDVTYRSPNRGTLTETFYMQGNAYLMNDSGKTIQSYACNPLAGI